jgi:hypothetical protein
MIQQWIQFMLSVFTGSSAKGCSWIDLSKPECLFKKAVFKMKVVGRRMFRPSFHRALDRSKFV